MDKIQNSNIGTIIIILITTFFPATGTFNLIKFCVIFALYIFVRTTYTNFTNKRESISIISLWILSIIVAGGCVYFLEGGINESWVTHEFSRVAYYAFLLLLCVKLSISFKQLFYCCVIVISIHFIIQLTQYLNLGTFNHYIETYYLEGDAENSHYLFSQYRYSYYAFRSGSIFINPNVYVCYPYISAGVFLEYYRRNNSMFALAMVAVCFVSVVFTGSRMGMISIVCIVAWFKFFADKSKKSGSGYFFALILLLLAFIYRDSLVSSMSDMRAFQINEEAYSGSTSIKLMGFLAYLSATTPIYLVTGSIGSKLQVAIDMEFGYIFAWFGVIGIIWYYKLLRMIYRNNPSYKVISRITCIGILLTSFSASSILNMSVFPYICVIAITNIIPEHNI